MRKSRDFPSSGSSSTSSGANNKIYKRRAKKEKEEEHRNVDMISHLPDPLLHHIFSFLDITQAIRTCILSKRWRYFWVSLPTLKINCFEGGRKMITNEFMDFVDRVLMFRGNSNIHEFTLVTNNSMDVTDRLNTWILVCIIHNLQQFTLNSLFPEKFQLHHCLFTCKSLTKLVVFAGGNSVGLSLPYSITLPSLKTLSLDFVEFKDEYSTNQLFSGCPILESLTITFCDFPNINVNISSPLLQHLILSNCITRRNALDLGPVETHFQLCAPNLISFYWANNMSKHCAPNNLSSLVRADISTDVYEDSKLSKEMKKMYAPFMVNLLRGLHNVEDLTLSAAFLEDYYGAPYLLEVQPTQCCNFRCLKLETLLSRDCLYVIAYFLKFSPKIENLSFILKGSLSSDKRYSHWNPDEVTSNSAKSGEKAGLLFEGLLNHVKCLELRNVTGRIVELEFIEIFLKNVMLLEELLIFFNMSYSYGKGKELEERRLAKFSEKVLTFPKASSNVVIMFKYVTQWY